MSGSSILSTCVVSSIAAPFLGFTPTLQAEVMKDARRLIDGPLEV